MSENNAGSNLDDILDLGSMPPDFDPFSPFADDGGDSENAASEQSQPAENGGDQQPEKQDGTSSAAAGVNGLIADLFPTGDSPFPEAPSKTGKPEEPGQAPENPIVAAIESEENKEAEQAAKSLFEKPPVFSYSGAVEEIENSSITFDQLRENKAVDFPELEDGKRISWSVVYGKISKRIPEPKKSVIAEIKKEIEMSEEFLTALKKSRDKNPECQLRPTVAAQTKGDGRGYKGAYLTLEEARESDKIICLIPSKEGRIFELRKTEMGEFITPKDEIPYLQEVKAGFHPALPLIPNGLLRQAVSFFRHYMHSAIQPVEVLLHVYWDKEDKKYFIHVPVQTAGPASIHAGQLDGCKFQNSRRYIHCADIHSHNRMEAQFSAVDNADEKANRIYIVIGRLDRFFPEISVRVCNGGTFLPIDPGEALELDLAEYPSEWQNNVEILNGGEYVEAVKGFPGQNCHAWSGRDRRGASR